MRVWSEEARRFLETHRVGHLATAGADGAPHVVPVCYALDDAALYFIADEKPKRRAPRELQRLKNLRENARAALVVDDYDEDWSRLAWVLVRGTASVLSEPAAHASRFEAKQVCTVVPPKRGPRMLGGRHVACGERARHRAVGYDRRVIPTR